MNVLSSELAQRLVKIKIKLQNNPLSISTNFNCKFQEVLICIDHIVLGFQE